MTRETKVGLMMVALLVGVFGFLIYQRIHRPLEGLAVQEPQEKRPSRLSAEDLEPEESRSQEVDTFSKRERPSAASLLETDGVSSSDRQLGRRSSESRSPQWKKPVSQTTSEEDFSEADHRRTTTQKSAHPVHDTEVVSTDFDEANSFADAPRVIAAAAEIPTPDPFENEVSSSTDDDAPQQTVPDRLPRPLEMPSEVEKETETEEPSFDADPDLKGGSQPSEDAFPTRPTRTKLVHQTSEFDSEMTPVSRDERQSAPVTFEEKPFSPETTTRAASTVRGPSYVIEPNDNFWTISRKRYGEGRFYMALARHNQQVISDPKRMRPGTTISTPDVAVLEQNYADLIPKPAAAEPAAAVVQTKPRSTEEEGPSGFFVSPDGLPMYRIVGHDTLSDIAKSHLGRSSRWVQILEMNRNVLRDGNDLKIGTVLRLPADASRVQVVSNPRDFR